MVIVLFVLGATKAAAPVLGTVGVVGVGASGRALYTKAVNVNTANIWTQVSNLLGTHSLDILRETGREGLELLNHLHDELAAAAAVVAAHHAAAKPWSATVSKKAQATVRTELERSGVHPTHAATLAAAGHALAQQQEKKA